MAKTVGTGQSGNAESTRGVYEGAAAFGEETAAVWEQSAPGGSFSAVYDKPVWKQEEISKPEAYAGGKDDGVKDDSGRLTRMLVKAGSQGEVRTILSEAYKNLSDMLKAALSGDPETSRKALAAIKRLNKLIQRGQRKISDLNKEDLLLDQKKQAEKKRMELRAKEIQMELCRRIAERKRREKNYLRDCDPKKEDENNQSRALSPAELQAQFMAMQQALEQIATTTAAAVFSGGTGETVTDGTAAASAAGGAAEGGEAVAAEGGEVAEAV